MQCADVRPKLVAWQDGELAPSELLLLERHLDGCADCQACAERLDAATPAPFIEHPAQRAPGFWDALDGAISAELDKPVAAPRPLPLNARVSDWLTEERRVSMASLLAYAAVVAALIGFGGSTWLENQNLRLALDETPAALAAAPAPVVLPADQFLPAAWAPPGESQVAPTSDSQTPQTP